MALTTLTTSNYFNSQTINNYGKVQKNFIET